MAVRCRRHLLSVSHVTPSTPSVHSSTSSCRRCHLRARGHTLSMSFHSSCSHTRARHQTNAAKAALSHAVRPLAAGSPSSTSTAWSVTTLPSSSAPSSSPPHRLLFGLSSAPSPPIKQQIRRRLPFPASALYSVVLDVPSYPHFLPYCLQATLLQSTPATHSFSAQLTLGFSQFYERYTSLVSYQSPATGPGPASSQLYRVHARSLDCTLFSHLSSTWEMRSVPGGRECDVVFDIEMSIPSSLHRAVVSRVFANVAEQQLKAFVLRTQQLMTAAEHDRADRAVHSGGTQPHGAASQ